MSLRRIPQPIDLSHNIWSSQETMDGPETLILSFYLFMLDSYYIVILSLHVGDPYYIVILSLHVGDIYYIVILSLHVVDLYYIVILSLHVGDPHYIVVLSLHICVVLSLLYFANGLHI